MKRLKPMIAILLMLCMVMLPACGGGKTDGGEQTGESGDKNRTINVALTTLVDSFYTPNEYGITEGYSLAQVYDTLIVQNEDGTYELPSTVTLLVNPAQATLLAGYEASGEMHLSLVYRGDEAAANRFLQAQDKVFQAEVGTDE